MPRRSTIKKNWASPLVWPLACDLGLSPNQGLSPTYITITSGGAKPRLTSGGEAANAFRAKRSNRKHDKSLSHARTSGGVCISVWGVYVA